MNVYTCLRVGQRLPVRVSNFHFHVSKGNVHAQSETKNLRAGPRWIGSAAVIAAAAVTLAACGGGNAATGAVGTSSGTGTKTKGTVKVALILKDFTNPYFISMEKSAKADAAKLGVKLTVSAGSSDGDTTTQITAIDNAIAAGDAGIIITPNGNAVNPALDQAKSHKLLVIALDTVPTPPSTADLTYATNNFTAGQLIGQYGAKRLNGKAADIAMLDLSNTQVISVDTSRDHGFLTGMGIPVGNAEPQRRRAQVRQLQGPAGRQRHLQDRLPAAHAGRGPRRPDCHGAVPVQGPEHQRGLRDQRAGRGRRGRGAEGRPQDAASSCWRSTAAAPTSPT